MVPIGILTSTSFHRLHPREQTVTTATSNHAPAFAFQLHITDECDQRCKHCYIFAEGECAGFKRMPWEQMVEVVDQAETL